MPKYPDPPGFTEWEATIPESFKRDPIWRTPAYRYSLWLSDLAKQDAKENISLFFAGTTDDRSFFHKILKIVVTILTKCLVTRIDIAKRIIIQKNGLCMVCRYQDDIIP